MEKIEIEEIIKLVKATARLKALLDSIDMTPEERDAEMSKISKTLQEEMCPNV